MTDQYEAERKVIEKKEAALALLMVEASKLKQFINLLCKDIGEQVRYPEENEAHEKPSISLGNIRNDQWTGKATATAVEEFLEMRKNSNLGAATLDEIFDALSRGGFEFKGKHGKKDVGITLGKNTVKFRKVKTASGDCFGLQRWYGGSKTEKSKGKSQTNGSSPENEDNNAQEGSE